MSAVPDYYQLLKNPMEEIPSSVWEEVVRSVVEYRRIQDASDETLNCLQNILFECSQEWIDRRVRIIRGAENDSSNPSRRSRYCLTSLRNVVLETSGKMARYQESPELSRVDRQVSDHLRNLRDQGILVSYRRRSERGKDICNMWGLASWGEDWKERQPPTHFGLNQLGKYLPVISADEGGKGVFDFANILPSFIQKLLDAYGAALSTGDIKDVVVQQITPPLLDESERVTGDDSRDSVEDTYFPNYGQMDSPEELVAGKELEQIFMELEFLTEQEKAVFQMKKQYVPIEQIALHLKCSPRTINNDWKRIQEKCWEVFESGTAKINR